MTASSPSGKKHWTKTTNASTPTRSKGWRRSLMTSSATSTARHPDSRVSKPNSTRRTWCNSAPNRGNPITPQRLSLQRLRSTHARRLTTPVLEARLNEACPQLQADQVCPAPGQEAPPPTKKPTRAQNIKAILHNQDLQPPGKDQHCFDTSNAPSVAPASTNGSMQRHSKSMSPRQPTTHHEHYRPPQGVQRSRA